MINKNIFKRKYILTFLIIILLIISALVFIWFAQEEKPNLTSEKIIREITASQFNKDPNELTDEDFAKITSLIIGKIPSYSSVVFTTELADIKLLEKFTNLQILSLNYIFYPRKDIPKWMTIIAKLGIFDFDKRFALDLNPLEKLQNLKFLYINTTEIKNIKPLSCLVNLQQLKIKGTMVSDIEPIKKLTNLRDFHIGGCPNITDEQVEDLQKALPNLKIER